MATPCFASEPEVLQRVTVRLLHEHERPQFDRLLETHHYLASAHLAGQTLRYVAELDGQWVALLTFSAAAFHLKLRERWLRWTPRQCARRLLFVVNNSRLLVLPARARYPNLASRVLGLCLRGLAADWQAQWGHPVLVVESFVDETRYRGAWFREQDPAVLARLAVDGKVLRGSGRTDGQPLQLLSAVSHHLRLTLAQVPIAEKSNEIPALQPLLRQLPSLAGTLITADALHCQQESARFITQELGGDYLFGLKGNQSGVLERAARLLAQEAFPP